MTTDILPFSHKLVILSVPRNGQNVVLKASREACAAVAAALDLPAVRQLEARFLVTPARSGVISVTGTVQADIDQLCVVSLEAFPSTINEKIDLRYMAEDKIAAPQKAEVERSLADIDPPEPLIGGIIDLGALSVEYLALALDPFARKPGVEMPRQATRDLAESPFAALSVLKKPPSP
jgi:hypothetical protein